MVTEPHCGPSFRARQEVDPINSETVRKWLCREEIAADELPVDDRGHPAPEPRKMEMRDWFRTLPASVDLRELLTAFEKGLIERALEQADGVQAEAARMLGVSRSDIGYKVTKFALGRPVDTT
jgi:transcriptional regulator with GAF, ATPase, and Fis domain